jgi:hypothetical protein
MPRVVLPVTTWRAVARELTGTHTAAAPPGLAERIHALLLQAPQGWSDQDLVLELDEGSAEAVRAIHAALTGADRHSEPRSAAVAEADRIIREHQQRG